MNIETFVKENSWQFQMNQSKGLDGWNNYSGGMDKPDWVIVVSRSRDSEIIDESNFECALDRLGRESKDVAVERFGHWACGWFELLLVNPKAKRKVKIAYDIFEELKAYPVLDESDYSERQTEYQANYAKGAQKNLAKALSTHFGLKNTKELENIAFYLNMECQQYYGDDACVDVYDCRKPDKRDVDRLKTCFQGLEYNYGSSKVFKKLREAVNAYQV